MITAPMHPKKGDTVLITEEDVRTFLAFRRNKDKFEIMLAAGVFDLQSGKAEVNVNNGQIQAIHIHEMTYKRPSDKL